MTFNFPKTLMVLLLCLTFVGQAMASTVMSYHMMSMGNMNGYAKSQQTSNVDHSGHQMMNFSSADTSDIDASENTSKDCCEKNCNCFTGGCASIAVLSKSIANDPVMDFSAKITSVSSLAPSQRLTSLYRPPILS